ncbi:MAG: proprotein convertase P-domain-containing protein, partial [Proteobacteria bacterium]|nr:proprotein convertase P-domain-containing protein [Pseudomonadota bacterium]
TGSLNCWYIKQVFRNCPDVAIPDAIDDDITPGEVTDSIAIAGTGLLVDSTFVLDVDITHTYYPDLEILLTSPEGTTLTIRPYGDGDGEDMLQGFSLTGFEGEALDGEWTITVQDWWTAGTGTLNCWTIRYLEDFTDPDCPVVPIPLAIADNVTPSETTSEITFAATGKTVDIAFTVEVNIGHPWVGDLAVRLTSPLGTTVTLLDKDTGEGSELAETYTTNGPLVDFLGEDLDGTWVLTVENWYEWETGELRCWKITQPEFSWTEDCPALDIPDCIDDEVTPSQVTSDIVLATPNTVSGEFAVGVDISHTYRGDLKLLLTSPSGTTLLLKTYNDDGNEDVLGVYPYSLIPAGSFSAFVGEPLAGTWTLTIEDWWTGDTGTLNCWAISDPGTPPAGDGADWDFEDGTTGDWFIYRNSNLTVMRNVLDPDEGDQVIELRANTMDTWFCLGAPGGGDLGETHTVLQWKMKSLGLFYFYVKVTTPAGERWLYYTPSDVDKLLQNLYVHHGAGYAATYGQWSTYVRDLAADLDEAEPGNTITTVDCLFVRGVNVRIDDIAFLAAIPAGWDSDGDGLTDAEENDVYGTSPYNADTDNDGMNDGPEAAMWGVDWNGDADDDGTVNLLDEDSDDDGFLDGMENAAGSDPADPLSVPAVARNFEDGSTAGWYIASGQGIIRNVADAENGTLVTELRGSRTSTMYGLVREDGTPWQDNVNTSITWKMKYSEMYYIYVDAVTTFGHRYMYYTPHDADYLSLGDYVHHGLGISSRDGTWRTFTRDLAADLDEAEPGNIILEVNRFLIRGSGRIDDVALVGGGG